MKKKRTIPALTFVLLIFFLPSCKKYDEGPSISFLSADKRLNASYTIDKIIVEGEDVLASIDNDSIQNGGVKFVYANDANEDFREFKFYLEFLPENIYAIISSGYDWINDKDDILLSRISLDEQKKKYFTSSSALFPYLNQTESVLHIKKLTNKEFVYEIDYNDKIYRYELSKK